MGMVFIAAMANKEYPAIFHIADLHIRARHPISDGYDEKGEIRYEAYVSPNMKHAFETLVGDIIRYGVVRSILVIAGDVLDTKVDIHASVSYQFRWMIKLLE